MTVIARWYRYTVLHEEEFDSVEEAARYLAYGEDSGDLSTHEIQDGDKIIGRPEVMALVDEQWDKLT